MGGVTITLNYKYKMSKIVQQNFITNLSLLGDNSLKYRIFW